MTVRILGAGGVKEGLRRTAEMFTADTGVPHEIEIETGPLIEERSMTGSANADLIAMPRPQFEALVAAGKVEAEDIVLLGFVTVGVTIRNGAREPDLSTLDSFVKSLLAAERVIYNKASSGTYVARTLERIGLADRIKGKILVAPDGKSAMEAVAADTTGNAIGFGHATEIRLHDHLGTHFVGPLPKEIGRQTPYAIGPLTQSENYAPARQLIGLIESPRGKAILLETGVLSEE